VEIIVRSNNRIVIEHNESVRTGSIRLIVGLPGEGTTRYPTANTSGLDFASSRSNTVTFFSFSKGFK